MNAKRTSKKPTYTATYDDGGVIYKNRPSGNLIGELPFSAKPTHFPVTGDPFDGARFETGSGRTITIRLD
jgi:hypothetical protein